MNITLTQLQYIVAVDTYGSFSKAAKECFVTQPTLSMQIQKLEDLIQVEIFDRKKKPIAATEIGRQIIKQARVTLREGKKIEDILNIEQGKLEGELIVGIIPTISPYLLPVFIKEYRESNPKVRLVVKELQTEEIIKSLKEDKIDVGILATPLGISSLKEKVCYYESFYIYLPEKHPFLKQKEILISDINLDEVLLLDDGHCFRDQALNICRAKSDDNSQLAFNSGNLETLKRLVDRGQGITLLPELMVNELSAKEKKRIRSFKKYRPKREISLIFNKEFLKKKLINNLHTSVCEGIESIDPTMIKKSGKIIDIN